MSCLLFSKISSHFNFFLGTLDANMSVNITNVKLHFLNWKHIIQQNSINMITAVSEHRCSNMVHRVAFKYR